jgi:LacI family transcriptional regulator
MRQRVTIKDVARHCGVSIAATSRALNNRGEVSPATRKLVLAGAAELGYIPNPLARGLVMGRLNTLGVVLTDNASPVYASILGGIEETAIREGFSVLLGNSAESQDQALRALDTLLATRVAGVLLVPTQHDQRDLERLAEWDTRSVLLLRRFPGVPSDYVVTDNERGSYLVTDHLIDLGHRRLAHIGGPERLSTAQERFAGFRKALGEHGMPVDEELVTRAPYTLEGGVEAARHLLQGPHRPTGIVAATDRQAVGVLKAAQDLGIDVPRDLAVVGGDDIELAEFLAVPLTTFRQRAYEIGARGVETLLWRLRNPDNQEVRQIVLEPQIVVRRSCGAHLRTEGGR